MNSEVLNEFQQQMRGRVCADDVTRHAYATDASMYQFLPLCVLEPVDREDVQTAVRLCARHQLPLLARGGGTSLVGQAVGNGVVIDLSRHCTRILAFNPAERWVRVEPGIVRDELNRYLQPHGLHFAPDPATTSRANIGGMIANNAAGMRSIQYGMTIDHLLAVDLLLADGEEVHLASLHPDAWHHDPAPTRSARLCQAIAGIVAREQDEIARRYPTVPRHSGGYALNALTGPPPWNFAKLIAGSEGTLGIVTAATLHLEPLPAHSGLCLAHFSCMSATLRAVEAIVAQKPTAVELLDDLILSMASEHPLTRHTCTHLEGAPAGLLIIESRADTAAAVAAQLAGIQQMLSASSSCYAAPVLLDPVDVKAVWTMRESALGLMQQVPGDRKPVPYIEDAAVPLKHLPEYIEAVLAICTRYEQPVSLFAHAGAGLLHIRPMHDLRVKTDRGQMLAIQDEVFELVKKFGGAWSGEHGDGIIRGHYNRAYFGERIYAAFHEIKRLFDPEYRMNPGKILDTPPRDAHLRTSAPVSNDGPAPMFHWRKEGSPLKAAEACTGVGACRQLKTGVMCPSYQATHDEIHSTRGRANVLRHVWEGRLGPAAMTSAEVHAVFDLCLSCKGCKNECPNQVDAGKMKAELLHHYYRQHRRPLRDQLLARPALPGRLLAGWPAPLANKLGSLRLVRQGLDRFLGLDARRPLPRYARLRFSAWFHRRPPHNATGTPVVLFNDVYTEFHEPELGRAAVHILEALGYQVHLCAPADSQRPALSLGLLDVARRQGGRLIQRLLPFAQQQWPILVLEPSCATALIDDLPDLVEDTVAADAVAAQVSLLDNFIAAELTAEHCPMPTWREPQAPVFYHPHCHQRALDQAHGTRSLLQMVPGLDSTLSTAGCCGMAGAFGYEKEHYDWSTRIAADRLLPALNACDAQTVVLANGFSCRHQIADLTGRQPLHPIQWLALQLAPAHG
jgi:FAD/FMN-containing dehydrogenase/Fe-S oxidoreductase